MSTDKPPPPHRRAPRGSLFIKYFVTLLIAVVTPLLLGAASEALFGYRGQRAALNELLQAESRSATERIQTFIDGIRDQLGWVVQLPWMAGDEERHRIDALRLLRQVPAISSIILVDEMDRERAFISRQDVNRIGLGASMASDSAIKGAHASKVWFGPVRYERDSEPYMTIAVAGNRAAAGIAIADINLKLIQEVIAAIKIGETGHAFVIDDSGRLIAHPDISQVLRGHAASEGFGSLTAAVAAAKGAAVVTRDADGKPAIATSARTASVDWTVIAQQPVAEAFAPIRAALWRSLALLFIGALFAISLAWWLARRMSGPIRQLEDGVQRIGAGQFEHRIEMSSGDELEQLANRFNEMAGELAASKEKSERIARLKRFLAPQVAELVEDTGNQGLLDGQRREVVAIFCDLRGFTAFSAHAEPEIIMGLLSEYYAAVGSVITRHQATLTGFAGDGLMVLVNAPIECDEPALRGVRLAIDMQAAVQALIIDWRVAGHKIGFGVGVAMGPATVGTVGYEGRIDYTAMGSVVNLASRLCGLAVDAQILLDPVLADAVGKSIVVDSVGERSIKGYERPMRVFSVL
ncbi:MULTISPECIES: adenylate/guanylate cyclase domain-containing protein [unclassified Bradyrhizobium]|uniref:cache domain-containing protein n=1 Tax=unclassified Bradyrhizobium TaxID=2631580 RepID=UPI001FF6FDCB|nr:MULTISPECIES: adenylate/guanylate cyclase domain-containing protein [unclassified Bradyrhizobium]MCK1709889.1 HAMP domain-containing protein [Bradyrhizobium sp. 143]MCK1725449.1 HAMP domain-containing protein [Bradyrhizobium sp. 142]